MYDDFLCPWCGEDLMDEFLSSRSSFDSVIEAHCEGCDVFQREMNGTTQQAPPCAGDEE